MKRMAYFTLILLIFFYCPYPAFSAQGSPDLGSACSTCTEHLLVASYVNVREFTSNLLLNNKGPDPLPISLAFFTLKGDPLPELPMTLPGNSPKLINLNELVIQNGLPFQEGSLQIRYQYDGCLLVLSAGLIQRMSSRGIVFDELFARPSTFRSSQLEAVFSLSSYPTSIGLTLTNTSPLKVKASIRYDALVEQNFSTQTQWLKPHETKVFYVENLYAPRFQGKVGPAGGVSIQHDGKPGDVVARGFLANASSGYSASVDFADPAMAETSTLQGSGLHLGPMGLVSLEPSLVVRNVGDASSSVTVKVPYLYKDGSTGLASLPIFSLEPGEIRVIKEELIQTLTGLSLQSNSQSLGLEIDYSAKPGTVVAFAQSVSPDGEQVFQLPLVDPGTKGAAGDYPWFITATSRPVVYLKNTTDKAQDYTVQIDFDGGGFVNGLKKIPAHQTAVIDIRELRDQELKDERGKTIPMAASSGKVSWSVVGPDAHSMIGRIEQTDLTAGISYSFACSNCCPNSYYDSFMNPNPIMLFMGGTVLVVPSEQDKNCYGGLLVPYTVSPSYWISGNPNIVTVQSGTVNGISPGVSTVTAQWVVNNWSPYHGYCVNHQVLINRGAPAQVSPACSISGPANVWWFNGATPTGYPTSITLTATPSGLHAYQWQITSGSNKAKFSNDSSTITTTTNSVSLIGTSPSGSLNDVQVKVSGRFCSTCSYGPLSPSLSVTVRSPAYLNPSLGFPRDQGTSQYGYYSYFQYEIMDNIGVQVPAAVDYHEYWTTLPQSDYTDPITGQPCNWERSGPGPGRNTIVEDVVGGERTSLLTLIPLVCKTWPTCGTAKVQHWHGEWRIGSATQGSGLRVMTLVWQKYENRARHE